MAEEAHQRSEPGAEEVGGAVRLVAPSEGIGDVPSYYSNFVQVNATPHDFMLHFGWYAFPVLDAPPPQGKPLLVPVQGIAKVAVPLNILRGLIGVLQAQADAWEQNFGQPLPVQPGTPPNRSDKSA